MNFGLRRARAVVRRVYAGGSLLAVGAGGSYALTGSSYPREAQQATAVDARRLAALDPQQRSR